MITVAAVAPMWGHGQASQPSGEKTHLAVPFTLLTLAKSVRDQVKKRKLSSTDQLQLTKPNPRSTKSTEDA